MTTAVEDALRQQYEDLITDLTSHVQQQKEELERLRREILSRRQPSKEEQTDRNDNTNKNNETPNLLHNIQGYIEGTTAMYMSEVEDRLQAYIDRRVEERLAEYVQKMQNNNNMEEPFVSPIAKERAHDSLISNKNPKSEKKQQSVTFDLQEKEEEYLPAERSNLNKKKISFLENSHTEGLSSGDVSSLSTSPERVVRFSSHNNNNNNSVRRNSYMEKTILLGDSAMDFLIHTFSVSDI
ncbi:hypothetical protein ADEAN_001039800 [Angomonas deanei]|uniref:Uncharacterized protein n=1 Tax=Angomonas deanei TaxID=59799 RepID=A0A7G2CV87_9TRYP|nr:hypothetical protein ADEAN_001039800 [Angomonas deanei]